ncbi:uncharacterized protein [Penaeus vannamei]|uniref:uncharacterized protein n=1 Tax=Penaeus vannamei TaxID=6689 RepID=UPI00387F4A59
MRGLVVVCLAMTLVVAAASLDPLDPTGKEQDPLDPTGMEQDPLDPTGMEQDPLAPTEMTPDPLDTTEMTPDPLDLTGMKREIDKEIIKRVLGPGAGTVRRPTELIDNLLALPVDENKANKNRTVGANETVSR